MGLQRLFDRIGAGGARRSSDHAVGAVEREGAHDVTAALQQVDDAIAAGDVVGALDLLIEANRAQPGPDLEVRLVDLRHAAAKDLRSTGRTPWPPACPDPFPSVVGRLPEVEVGDLDAEVLGGAVGHHGCLLVRGLFTDAQVARTLDAIRSAAALRDAPGGHGSVDRWYRPFPSGRKKDEVLRQRTAERGGTWLVDSPAACAQVLDDLESVGVIDAITGHFGERPLISLQKSTLRRSAPVHENAAWHQDGSFLGGDARAMNVWVALTPCGGDRPTPSLEVVPRRLEQILSTDGGVVRAAVSEADVLAAAGGTPPIRPQFEPGDGLLFDERFLHRTSLREDMTEERYALECWFFAPAHEAETYLSFLV